MQGHAVSAAAVLHAIDKYRSSRETPPPQPLGGGGGGGGGGRVKGRKEGRKEGRNWVLPRFQQLRSYRDEIETRNREEIPYSSRIVTRGLSVAKRP